MMTEKNNSGELTDKYPRKIGLSPNPRYSGIMHMLRSWPEGSEEMPWAKAERRQSRQICGGRTALTSTHS